MEMDGHLYEIGPWGYRHCCAHCRLLCLPSVSSHGAPLLI